MSYYQTKINKIKKEEAPNTQRLSKKKCFLHDHGFDINKYQENIAMTKNGLTLILNNLTEEKWLEIANVYLKEIQT